MPKPISEIARGVADARMKVLKGDFRSLMPLLEHSYSPMEEFRHELEVCGVTESEILNYDLESLIVGAMEFGGSGYWAALALGWLNTGMPHSPRILEAIAANELPKSQQKARQLAKRLLKRGGQ